MDFISWKLNKWKIVVQEKYKDEASKYEFVRAYEYSENEVQFILDSFNDLKNQSGGGLIEEIPRSSIVKKIVSIKFLFMQP